MPLDTRKVARIKANYKRILLQRTQQVTLTTRNSDGSNGTIVVNALFRGTEDNDPTMHPDTADPLHSSDAIMQILTADITIAQLRSVILVTPAAPTGVANAYRITYVSNKGMIPGGTRWLVALKRQH